MTAKVFGKRSVVSAFLACALVAPGTSGASGVGVTVNDPMAISRLITDYAQQLEQYAQLVTQTALSENQLLQLYADYQQTLIEYNHLLNQIRGIAHYVSSTDWDQALIEIAQRPNTNSIYDVFDVNVYGSAGWMNVNNRVREVYEASREIGTIQGDVTALGLGAGAQDDVAAAYRKAHQATAQMVDAESLETEMAKKQAARNVLEIQRELVATQDEADLATLQYMAGQNIAIVDNLQLLQQQLHTMFLYQNQMEAEVFSNQAAAFDREINRARTALMAPTYVPNNTATSAPF